jgi:hypothetical protein
MTQEQLRMQMLAGIITEGQYKEKIEGELFEKKDLNFSKKMKPLKSDFNKIKDIMGKYQNQNPIKSFPEFAEEVEKKLDMEFGNNLQWSRYPENGFHHLFTWAIDNVASLPSQESLIPPENIIYRGGPGNSWILRSWE